MEREHLFNATEFDNIKDIIYDSVKRFNEKDVFVIKHKDGKDVTYENISYNKMLEDINGLGTKLYDLGFKNKRIAVIGKNRYEWVLAHFTNVMGGIISVPLDKDLQLDELESSLIRSKADAIFFDSKIIDNIKEIEKRKSTNLKEFICMDEIDGYKNVRALSEEGKKLIKNGNSDYINYEIDCNALSILLFTSGTTSKSKAVMLSQKNIASNVYGLTCIEEAGPKDTNIAFLPFHHIFGSTCILWTVSCGVKNVFPDGLRYIKQNLCEYKVSIFVGVPILIESMYRTVMKEIDKQGKTKVIKIATKISNLLLKLHIDIRRKLFKPIIDALGGELRFVVSGGAPADSTIAKGFNDIGILTLQGYGLTETGPVIAAEDKFHMRKGTVGLPMIGDIIEIDDKDELGIGEIKVKGPNVMLGYYEMPEETNAVIKDGWFYTGDLGYIDRDGYITITGRSKSMIVLKNGKKVFPEELESIINGLELVQECMVFGLPDNEDKNDIKLSVKVVYDKEIVSERYPEISNDELRKIIWEQIKKINTTFPRYKHIQNMILTDEELIKTTTKKVKRYEEMKKMSL